MCNPFANYDASTCNLDLLTSKWYNRLELSLGTYLPNLNLLQLSVPESGAGTGQTGGVQRLRLNPPFWVEE